MLEASQDETRTSHYSAQRLQTYVRHSQSSLDLQFSIAILGTYQLL